MTRPEIRTYHLPGDERMRYVLSQDRGLIQLKLNSFEAMLEKNCYQMNLIVGQVVCWRYWWQLLQVPGQSLRIYQPEKKRIIFRVGKNPGFSRKVRRKLKGPVLPISHRYLIFKKKKVLLLDNFFFFQIKMLLL